MTVQQFITANKIDTRNFDLEKYALNNCTKVPHTYKYSEAELNRLVMQFNLSCFLPTKRTLEYGYIYLLKAFKDGVFTNTCKVGTSIDVHKRVLSLNKSWFKCGVRFEIHKISNEVPMAKDIEGCIHQVLKAKNMSFKPNCNQSGRSEIFRYEEWIDNLIP